MRVRVHMGKQNEQKIEQDVSCALDFRYRRSTCSESLFDLLVAVGHDTSFPPNGDASISAASLAASTASASAAF